MTPLDLFPEYEDITASLPKPKISHGSVASKFATLEDAKKKMAPIDYAVSLLAAFATQWEEDLEYHSHRGANHAVQTAARRVMQLSIHDQLEESLQTLISHLRLAHPLRDPLFLKSAKEIASRALTWGEVSAALKNIKGLQGAYPEEVKIGNLIDDLISKMKRYYKEADLEQNAQHKSFHEIFEMPSVTLIDLIEKYEGAEAQFRRAFFPRSLKDDTAEEFKEDKALWQEMWLSAKHNHNHTLTKNDQQRFEWLKKRGETREET